MQGQLRFGAAYGNLVAAIVAALLAASIAMLAGAGSFGGEASAQQAGDDGGPSFEAPPGQDFVEGQLIVKTSGPTGEQQVNSLNQQNNAQTEEEFPEGDIQVIDLPEGTTVREAEREYESRPGVEFAEPDFIVYPHQENDIQPNAIGPDDPRFNRMYGLRNVGQTGGTADADIGAVDAWDKTTGSAETVVAVIDTGTNISHPDLVDNIWRNEDEIPNNGRDDDGNGFVDDVNGWDFFNDDNTVFDDPNTDLHGTHVSGTIGALGNNSRGVTGVNWDVGIMPVKFLGAEGGSTSDAIKAIDYAVENGAMISNNSWGGGGRSLALEQALTRAESDGHLFIASAGNNGQNADLFPSYPAAYENDNVVSVAATDDDDELAEFSNRGATSVDLGAPGVDILSTLPLGSERSNGRPYGLLSGTSMASPHVSGVAALVKSQQPNIPEDRLKRRILNSGDPIEELQGQTVSGNRLNADRALR